MTETIRPFDHAADAALIPQLAALLVEAVADGASISFMAGFDLAAATGFWTGRADAVRRGEAVLLVALHDGAVAGTLTLVLDTPPNQPHRADVAKMIVALAARGQGVGARLLAAVEAEAAARGRTTLVLDTISGSTAARLYERGGWQRIGEIADYALMPDGTMAPTTIYARHL